MSTLLCFYSQISSTSANSPSSYLPLSSIITTIFAIDHHHHGDEYELDFWSQNCNDAWRTRRCVSGRIVPSFFHHRHHLHYHLHHGNHCHDKNFDSLQTKAVGWKATDWNLENPDWKGKMRMVGLNLESESKNEKWLERQNENGEIGRKWIVKCLESESSGWWNENWESFISSRKWKWN